MASCGLPSVRWAGKARGDRAFCQRRRRVFPSPRCLSGSKEFSRYEAERRLGKNSIAVARKMSPPGSGEAETLAACKPVYAPSPW
jgi:hypothetical protein